ncbi:MAG TPA: hypothetical protein VGL17_04745 [Gemmatimonadaceae bacterium]
MNRRRSTPYRRMRSLWEIEEAGKSPGDAARHASEHIDGVDETTARLPQ